MQCFIVAAFSDTPFHGNPAGVCVLDAALPPATMQAIAAELRQPETAFVLRTGDDWAIRWFSPVVEVALCGHATLAAACVLWNALGVEQHVLHFASASGPLAAERDPDGTIWLDFPATAGTPGAVPAELAACIDIGWVAAARHDDRWLLECADAAAVRAARPDFARLARTGIRSLILTARSDRPGHDIVSRNFAPIVGVDEDQVTGAAHACLAPHWHGRLGPDLTCWQASARGGTVRTRLRGDRVALGGRAVIEFAGAMPAIAMPTAPA
ncbi:PhzF family phenazine biosynthesis protein [Sphingomonas flavalba]|uniref:PhzF family phenazine biosynthesis protein n=1 Tax=Sphingomonas flavalba TaxID=2559804 RepID=UPI0039E15B81